MAAIRGDLVAIAASDGEQIVNPRADRDIGTNMVRVVPAVSNSEFRHVHLGGACRTDQTDALPALCCLQRWRTSRFGVAGSGRYLLVAMAPISGHRGDDDRRHGDQMLSSSSRPSSP